MKTKPPRDNYPVQIRRSAKEPLTELCARMTIDAGRNVARPEAIETAINEALATRRERQAPAA